MGPKIWTKRSKSAQRLAHVEDASACEGAEVPEHVELLQILVSRVV